MYIIRTFPHGEIVMVKKRINRSSDDGTEFTELQRLQDNWQAALAQRGVSGPEQAAVNAPAHSGAQRMSRASTTNDQPSTGLYNV